MANPTGSEALLAMMRAQFKRTSESAPAVKETTPAPIEQPAVKPPVVAAGIDFAKIMANMKSVTGAPETQVTESEEAKAADFLPAVIPPPPALIESEEVIEGIPYEDRQAELADAVAEYDAQLRAAKVYDSEHVDAVLQRATNILEGVTFNLDDSQRQAVIGLLNSHYGCLMGAAGTGKSTCVRFLLNGLINGWPSEGIEPMRIAAVDIASYSAAARQAKAALAAIDEGTGDDIDVEEEEADESAKVIVPAIALVAFTGQAVQVLKKNLPPNWRRNAMTIHSLLGYAPEEYINAAGEQKWRFAPTYTRVHKMPWDAIVIDEASMVNIDLYHQLIDAAKETCRIYFVGDLNQLVPAIGQGIFGFALAKLPVFELTTIHRQADEAANKIVDVAWSILKGKFNPETDLDDPTTNANWRVIGMKISNESAQAHQQISAIAKGLSQRKVPKRVNPDEPAIYDPWRDRILTPMNGYNEESTGALLGQFPLNETLAQVFADGHERMLIDFKKGIKRFAVGYRVMATKNEGANVIDRVTNGLTGIIESIEPNPDWMGDWRLVGFESMVRKNRSQMAADALALGNDSDAQQAYAMQESLKALDKIDFSSVEGLLDQQPEERQSGPSSHIVVVKFDNGATRVYRLNADIEQLQIAYASTVHKAQGSEMPTVLIVVHHLQKRMLFRESLYTAVTRARERVVFLYTDYAFRIAQANQKISGSTLAQKIEQYLRLMGESDNGPIFKQVDVRLTSEDNENYHERRKAGL